jgi:putative endonuclease
MHFVYIVRCADATLYTGYARDPSEREKAHNSGRGAKYTAQRRPVSLVYSEVCESLGGALKREHQLKRLTRAEKEALIATTTAVVKGSPRDKSGASSAASDLGPGRRRRRPERRRLTC